MSPEAIAGALAAAVDFAEDDHHPGTAAVLRFLAARLALELEPDERSIVLAALGPYRID